MQKRQNVYIYIREYNYLSRAKPHNQSLFHTNCEWENETHSNNCEPPDMNMNSEYKSKWN